MLLILSSLACLVTFASADDNLERRDACISGYTLCSPAGATTTVTPQIGDSEFQNLFVDIVRSSLPASKRSLSIRDSASLCCISTLDCLTMNTLSLPFCYDKFTTNYFLPDGSFGTVVGGAYTSATKDTANLETGDFTLSNGTTGNLYSANEAAKPNTAALPLPSQFTGSGVGSAIPASALGDEITLTFTTTFSETTVPATIIPESTITSLASVIFASSVVTATVSIGPSPAVVLSTESPTPISTVQTTIIISPTTIDATTIQASVSVITTTFDSASNPAIFGTGGTTATGTTSALALETKKSTGSLHRALFASVWSVFGLCGLVGLILLL